MKTIKKIAAQGDVLFRRVDEVPSGFEPTKDRVIAHSETGHNHVAVGECEVMRGSDPMIAYLIAKGPVQIDHHRSYDTHESLKLLHDEPKGEVIWEIRRQREHTPEGWRRVED